MSLKLPNFQDPKVMKQINDGVKEKIKRMHEKGIKTCGTNEKGDIVLTDGKTEEIVKKNEPDR